MDYMGGLPLKIYILKISLDISLNDYRQNFWKLIFFVAEDSVDKQMHRQDSRNLCMYTDTFFLYC